MAGIKLVPGRMAQLRQTLNTEQARLQETADQLARIAASLDMELKARQSIDSNLTRLRSDLKRQAGNMGTMVGLANTAEAGLAETDQDLANKASELLYTMRQMMQSAGAAGGAGGVGYSPSRPAFTLGSLLDSSAFQNATDLFGFTLVNYDPIGVSLKELSGKIRDSLSALASPAGLATAAGAGVALAGTGLSSLLSALNNRGKVLGASSQKATAEKTSTKKKKETWQDKLKGFGSSITNAASNVWEGTKEAVSDTWEGAKDLASDVWDGAKDLASDTWEGAKDLASNVWEGAKDTGSNIWNAAKDIANSKPMEYVWEMGGSAVGGLGDVFSFCVNVGKRDFTGAAADAYSFVDNFFDFSQDLSALGAYGLGAGFEALGIGGDDVMDRAIEMADEISGRDGLKGELEASGFDTTADIVGGVDATVNTYKFVTGIGSLKDDIGGIFTAKDHGAELKKVLFESSGWKLPSTVTDSNAVLQGIGKSDALFSNVDLAYKYVDGFLTDSGLETILSNTQLGKIITGPGKILGALADEVS